ncbi:MAG TPA: type IV pilus twitching motility protein PilT [Acidimicrobiales bacterium]|nr:type IV pilus twitching motility protein PilT [Acidimicrobiales bacterium]
MANVDSSAIDPWLQLLWDHKGSDLLMSAGSAPRLRLDGALVPIQGVPDLTPSQIRDVIGALLLPVQLEAFEERKDFDFAFSWKDRARMRGNAFNQRGSPALALRMIPMRIPSFEELLLPQVVGSLANTPRGLVLVTGPTGSGKSTTLASIIDYINENRPVHVLTVEDPIEYLHHHKRAIVNQREVGVDSPSFDRALREALREDPDVLLVGEMRDLESISIALTMAETGHLVFATLHTYDAPQAIDRIIDVFPAERKDLIRIQMAGSLTAVIAQRLINRVDGGRVAAFEVLLANNACKALLREGKTYQLRNVITTSQSEGMRTLEMSLIQLVDSGTISYDAALDVSMYPKDLVRAMA